MSLTKCYDAIGFQDQDNGGFVWAAAFAYLMYREVLLICTCNCVISIHILGSPIKPNIYYCKLCSNERITSKKECNKIHQIQMVKTTELTNIIIKDSTLLLSNTAS